MTSRRRRSTKGTRADGRFAMTQASSMPLQPQFEIRFRSLLQRGLELIFPCDRDGRVDLDVLSDRAKINYLFARAMVGREYSRPAVCRHGGSQEPVAD